jgi:hypothetical protein
MRNLTTTQVLVGTCNDLVECCLSNFGELYTKFKGRVIKSKLMFIILQRCSFQILRISLQIFI